MRLIPMPRRSNAHIEHFELVPGIKFHKEPAVLAFKKFHYAAGRILYFANGFQSKAEKHGTIYALLMRKGVVFPQLCNQVCG